MRTIVLEMRNKWHQGWLNDDLWSLSQWLWNRVSRLITANASGVVVQGRGRQEAEASRISAAHGAFLWCYENNQTDRQKLMRLESAPSKSIGVMSTATNKSINKTMHQPPGPGMRLSSKPCLQHGTNSTVKPVVVLRTERQERKGLTTTTNHNFENDEVNTKYSRLSLMDRLLILSNTAWPRPSCDFEKSIEVSTRLPKC